MSITIALLCVLVSSGLTTPVMSSGFGHVVCEQASDLVVHMLEAEHPCGRTACGKEPTCDDELGDAEAYVALPALPAIGLVLLHSKPQKVLDGLLQEERTQR